MLSTSVLLVVCSLGLLKITAYFREMLWFLVKGSSTLLPAYQADPIRTYEKDHDLGRPRLFSRRAERVDAGRLWLAWRLLFKAPSVVVALFLGVALTATKDYAWALVLSAAVSCALGVLMLLVPVVMRLTLGPYDVLNPDLRVPGAIAKRMFERRLNSLALYILVLISMTILCFASTYNALGCIPGAILPGTSTSGDSIQWIFSAIAISATEGFGDVIPRNDGIRIVIAAQMVLGPIALAWVAASFFGAELPDETMEKLHDARLKEIPAGQGTSVTP